MGQFCWRHRPASIFVRTVRKSIGPGPLMSSSGVTSNLRHMKEKRTTFTRTEVENLTTFWLSIIVEQRLVISSMSKVT